MVERQVRAAWGRAGWLPVLLLAIAGVTAGAMAQAPTPAEPRTMIVLDGSGSMWGKMGRDVKVNAARDELKEALGKPGATSLGLTVFGHRRNGDCSDVEVAVPPGPGTAERVTAFLDKYNPKGKGPVGNALKAAVEAFESADGPAGAGASAPQSVILIADNADNCKIDTCALAAELKQKRPGLTAHVIGLGVPKEEMASLACIAQATGGKAARVESAEELKPVLQDVLRLAAGVSLPRPTAGAGAAAPTPPPVPAPRPVEQLVGKPGLRLSAVLAPGGPPVTTGLRWRVLADDGAKGSERRVLLDSEEGKPSLDLEPGAYRVEATFGLVAATRQIKVGGQGPTPLELVLNAGTIAVKDSSARAGTTPSTERIFYTLYASADATHDKPRALALTSDQAPVYQVAAGRYVVGVQQGLARIERSVTVAAGANVDVDVPLYLGELRLTASATEGGAMLERVFFQVFEDDPEQPDGLRELVRSGAPRPEFSLPAGTYHVFARADGAEARERVTVKPGARLAKTLVLASGRLTLATKLAGRGGAARIEAEQVAYRIESVAGSKSKAEGRAEGGAERTETPVLQLAGPEPSTALAAGRWRVEGRYGPANVRTVREVEVKAGGAHALTIEHEAGHATLKAPPIAPVAPEPKAGDAKTGDKPGETTVERGGTAAVLWEVLDTTGRVIWATVQGEPRVPLQAGRYVARFESRGERLELPFQIGVGDERVVEMRRP